MSSLKKTVPLPQEKQTAPVFILVRPQLAENVGMCARAMMNCGLYRLRVVAPLEDIKGQKALDASSGAGEILKHAEIFATVEEAVADLAFVAATTGRTRDLQKKVILLDEAIPLLHQKQSDFPEKTGVLFGPERTGLLNADLALADVLVRIPLNSLHPSLNLAQAVLILAYEYTKESYTQQARHHCQKLEAPAEKKELAAFFFRLETELEACGYLRFPDKKQTMMDNLKAVFLRAAPSSQEIRSLQGVLTDLRRFSVEKEPQKKE
jgi:tRNA/rRNA methyltransferase